MVNFQFLYDKARQAGFDAVSRATIYPMVVGRAKDLFSNEIVPGTEEYVADGPCGFAWINVKPGTSKFARWLKENKLARTDSYYGGVTIWVGDFNQSLQKKEAYADAFAQVLRDNDIKAYSASRMD